GAAWRRCHQHGVLGGEASMNGMMVEHLACSFRPASPNHLKILQWQQTSKKSLNWQ
ncbi:unnamed protein product, partial [Musa acuminata subsp. burmannicoides]